MSAPKHPSSMPPPPPSSATPPKPAPVGAPPLRNRPAVLRAPNRTIGAVAITESVERIHRPVPSRRRGWLIGWLLLAVIALGAIVYALSRPDAPEGSVNFTGPSTTVPSDAGQDTEPSFSDTPDEPDTQDTNVEDDVDENDDVAPPSDPVGGSPTDIDVSDPDFEPKTSINPPVTLE